MLKVGLVGWRGMVGSVLMQRMVEENDFAHIDPVYFTTSNPAAPRRLWRQNRPGPEGRQKPGRAQGMDVIITCQGGDYTTEVYGPLRAPPAGTATGSTPPAPCAWKTKPSSSSTRSI